jgi:hypothetical protein
VNARVSEATRDTRDLVDLGSCPCVPGEFLKLLRDAQSIHVSVGGLAEDGQTRLTIADPQIAKTYYNKLHLASAIQSSGPSHSDEMLASLWHPQIRPGGAFPFFPVKGVQSWISS